MIAGILSIACTTKVSEWVLLNAEPDMYTLVYFHKSPESSKTRLINETLSGEMKPANITFKSVIREDASSPYYGLYYEDRLFSRYDDPAQLKDLISSPLRNRIASDLMAGKLCVMVYLRSGIKEKDERGIAVVRKTLASSPFGGIITIVELDRTDALEKHFVSLLLNVESDLKRYREPMLFGVFGKFKALEPLLAGGITEVNINLMIDFLTADCSCLIKDDLPGTDILYINKWDSPAIAQVNAILDSNPALMHK
jgi:hypothetical protein